MLNLADKYFIDKKKKPFAENNRWKNYYEKNIKIPSGPLIGVILKKIKEEQALGKTSTKSEALKRAKQIITKAS